MSKSQPKFLRRALIAVAVVALGLLAQRAGFDLSSLSLDGSAAPVVAPSWRDREASAPNGGSADDALERIDRAIAARESGFMITLDAEVIKTLGDDLEGSRHQRFLIELSSGRILLVAHNIDLAKRVPLARGDDIRIRGQYEWNERGGVLHWTHRDPDGRHPGGWIEHDRRRID